MNVLTLIMAGGQGERARRSIGPIPKPLVLVRGVPLIERNLTILLRQGLREIVVSVPALFPEIKRFVLDHGRRLIESEGGTLEVLEEHCPRGNIGCAAELCGRADTVLVVFADNLTTFDLRLLLDTHRRNGASLTMATHLEAVQIPFGEIEAVHGRVVAYREKPSRVVLICSGIYALGEPALAAIPRDEPMGVSELAQILLARGEIVSEHRHSAPWVDVNNADALRRAEDLMAEHQQAFELPDSCHRAS
jgi:NDP-sugar pyrophosphorylase family protein